MRINIALFAASLLVTATCAVAWPYGPAQDIAGPAEASVSPQPDGKALFESRCRCHGPQGPKKFRGKNPEYVARALRNSRTKVLTSGKMSNVVGLSDEEIDALARYLSLL